jgi:hypothetical protein
MQILLLRYTQSLITQMAQTAVCNRHHSVDQQLSRWPWSRRKLIACCRSRLHSSKHTAHCIERLS